MRTVLRMQPGHVVSGVLLSLIEASRAPANLDGELVEALADHVHATRFGDGLDGLVVGQGLVLRYLDFPECLPGRVSSDGVLCVRAALDRESRTLVALRALAGHVLGRVPHAPADLWRLALAIGAPRSTVENLRRCGRLRADELAAETGLPLLAAGYRIGA
jgi:hypothetical protein